MVNKNIGKVFDIDYFYFVFKYPKTGHFLVSLDKKPIIDYIEYWLFFKRKSKYYNEHNDIFKKAFSY